MPIVRTEQKLPFARMQNGEPFIHTTTLYTRTEGEEVEREHIFFKIGRRKAITLDKRISIHMLRNTPVQVCAVTTS